MSNLWNLDDMNKYKKILSFTINKVFTFGDKNKDKGEKINIRNLVKDIVKTSTVEKEKNYAFRITVFINKKHKRRIDIDNIPKLIIDSFSQEDKNNKECVLYKDDCYPNVKIVEVMGINADNNDNKEKVIVEIFECL